MRNTIPFIFLLIIFACQQRNHTNKATISEDKLVDFEFTEETHNFGNLEEGQIVAYTLDFKNMGTENIYIHSAETYCNCVKTSYSDKPILPGSSGHI